MPRRMFTAPKPRPLCGCGRARVRAAYYNQNKVPIWAKKCYACTVAHRQPLPLTPEEEATREARRQLTIERRRQTWALKRAIRGPKTLPTRRPRLTEEEREQRRLAAAEEWKLFAKTCPNLYKREMVRRWRAKKSAP